MRRSLNSLFDVYKEKLSSLASAMQNANNKIAQVKSDKAKDEAVDYAKSEIKILDEKISLKVEKGNLISSINLEPDNIKIHANKLSLTGDAGNKCQNPSFQGYSDSDWYGGITVVPNIGSEAQYWGRTVVNGFHWYGDEFNVIVGDTYYIGCHCKTYSGSGYIDMGIRVKTTTGETYLLCTTYTTSSVKWIENKVTIPTNAISARIYVNAKNSTRWDFSNVLVRNAINSELIVDGAIKASHIEAEEFQTMFNSASNSMVKINNNGLSFADKNSAIYAGFNREKLNFYNWNNGYIGSLTRSHMSYPETEKEGTVQLSGQYGYFHEFAYNSGLSSESYDISNTSYTSLMRIQYRQSDYYSPGVYIWNKPLYVESGLYTKNYTTYLQSPTYVQNPMYFYDTLSMGSSMLKLNNSRNYIQENGGRFEVSVSSTGQFVLGSNSGSGVNWHFELNPTKNSFFMRKNLNFEWNGYIYNTSIQNTYSDVQSRSFKETSTIESIHSQIRIPIKSKITNGSCKINIPSAFNDIMKDYIVVGLTKYGKGDIWIEEEYDTYFIVKADNDIKFSLDIVINKI